MCGTSDVLQATYQSADTMTRILCDYGSGSMGNGIRKLTEEYLKTGKKMGQYVGYKQGFLEGVATSTIFISFIGVVALGTKKAIKNYKERKEEKVMAKYKIEFDGELEDEEFEKEEDAEEYASYLKSCTEEGAETLHLSNPGDYEEACDVDIRVVEIDD